jgi:hypothetical protein
MNQIIDQLISIDINPKTIGTYRLYAMSMAAILSAANAGGNTIICPRIKMVKLVELAVKVDSKKGETNRSSFLVPSATIIYNVSCLISGPHATRRNTEDNKVNSTERSRYDTARQLLSASLEKKVVIMRSDSHRENI